MSLRHGLLKFGGEERRKKNLASWFCSTITTTAKLLHSPSSSSGLLFFFGMGRNGYYTIRWIFFGAAFIMNSSHVFTNLFHKCFPRIFLSLSSWKRKTNFLLVQNRFIFLSLPVEKEIITNIRRFGIRDWWNVTYIFWR